MSDATSAYGDVPEVWTCPICGGEFLVTARQARTHESLCEGDQ